MLAIDTNILYYALLEESDLHPAARQFLESKKGSDDVVISELVLVELYRLLRNPVLSARPLSSRAAVDVINSFRLHPKWRVAGFPADGRLLHDKLWQKAADPGFAYRRIYDARLALSLAAFGVDSVATANVRDFEGFGFKRVWNPLTK